MSKSQFKRGSVVNFGGYRVVIIRNGPDVTFFELEHEYQDTTTRENFYGAWLTGEKPFKVVTGKVDGYNGAVLKRGKEQYISVGCRIFHNLSEAKKHWSNGKTGYHFGGDGFYERDGKELIQRRNANSKRYADTKTLVAKMKEA